MHQQALGDDLSALSAEMQQLFASGQAILLLDGLDEVPQGEDERRRRQIRSLVASLVAAYPRLRIIITSRPPRLPSWGLGPGRFRSRRIAAAVTGTVA